MKGEITIQGARENNLKDIDVHLPWHKVIVITGVSGSGKSSLALDTLYAEGLRRYFECLSTYARQFFDRIDRPDMDDIKGLPPVIAIESRNNVKHSRSSVGTTTEVYDYLRLLFAKVGTIYCPSCGREVNRSSPELISPELIKDHTGKRAFITFAHPDGGINPERLLASGFTRVLIDGDPADVEELKSIPPDAEVVVDRVVIDPKSQSRITESIETAFSQSPSIRVHIEGDVLKFSKGLECPFCPEIEFAAPTPLLFSYNSPQGACRNCNGFGNILDIDPQLVVPNPDKSLKEGAIDPLTKPSLKNQKRRMLGFANDIGADINAPYKKLPEDVKTALLEGRGTFRGIRGVFKKLEEKNYKLHVRVFLSKYRSAFPCPSCEGSRIRREALWVKVAGRSINELTEMPIAELKSFFDDLTLSDYEQEIAEEILKQITSRTGFLLKVGLGYITLSRLTKTLSGGEAQRANLACQLGASLTETLYIMDEPSIGLHPRDINRLVSIVHELRERRNTVVIVEHDFEIIRSSDYIIELGPRAGTHGGEVVFQGPLKKLINSSNGSLTRNYLVGDDSVPLPKKRRRIKSKKLSVYGASENNLKNIDVVIPLGTLTCVTGVSGSGKSSFVRDVLYAALVRKFYGKAEKVGAYTAIKGTKHIKDVVMLDQSPIGRSSRSNPVTYIKAYDDIRGAFAATWEARAKGLTPSSFSFNVPGGRCESCQGEGTLKIEMHFLADVNVMCEECGGKRFRTDVLDVRYHGRNIDEVLSLTVREALGFFSELPALQRKLNILDEVGLGYLKLGQPAPTLSGGEAQRIKIARELGRKDGTAILYMLDEPTVGLHADDIKKLLNVLNKLVEAGNTVLVIEHNLDVIKSADWVIDLGPEGGEEGGYIVAEGRPEDVSKVEGSYTGRYLRGVLNIEES
ncbi:MAG: excinuclease ABC subunit UvrA [Thermodesulfobacteriota bacterium]